MLTSAVSIAGAYAAGSTWAVAWSQTDLLGWTEIYTDDIVYTDYAFGFDRRGKDGLRERVTSWLNANPDFQVTVVKVWPGSAKGDGKVKYNIRTQNVGIFTIDLRLTTPYELASFLAK